MVLSYSGLVLDSVIKRTWIIYWACFIASTFRWLPLRLLLIIKTDCFPLWLRQLLSLTVHSSALIRIADLFLGLLSPRSDLQVSRLVAVCVFHRIFPSLSRVVVVRAENNSTVDGIELSPADLGFVRLWVILRLLDVVGELAFVSLLALLLLITRNRVTECWWVGKGTFLIEERPPQLSFVMCKLAWFALSGTYFLA